MTGGFAGYPVADPNARPPSVFRIYDPGDGRDPHEIIRVIDTGGTHVAPTAAWQVVRATEGSPGTAHKAGFEVAPFLTKAGLDGRAAGTPSRTGLVLRSSVTAPRTWNDNAEHNVASLTIGAGEQIVALLYQAVGWGYFSPGATTPSQPPPGGGPANPDTHHFDAGLLWGANVAGQISFPVPNAPNNSRWRIHATLEMYATQMIATISLWAANRAVTAVVNPKSLFGILDPFPANVSGSVPFRLFVKTPGTGGSGAILGGGIWRAA